MRLELKEITFSYAGAPSHLFDSLSLVIQGPGFFSLFGLSGCGKSTLSHIISGMTPPESGEVTGDGGIVLYAHAGERFPAWMSIGDHLRRVSPSQGSHMLRSLMELMGLTDRGRGPQIPRSLHGPEEPRKPASLPSAEIRPPGDGRGPGKRGRTVQGVDHHRPGGR